MKNGRLLEEGDQKNYGLQSLGHNSYLVYTVSVQALIPDCQRSIYFIIEMLTL